MTIRTTPWRRRVPTLLVVAALHAVFIVVFLRGLTIAGHALIQTPLLANILTPPPSAPPPPALPAPKLPQAPPIPQLIAPVVLLPDVISTPAALKTAAARRVPVRAALPASGAAVTAPKFLSAPLDANDYYPMAARLSFAQGQAWTRVCVYSTGEVASVSLSKSSGNSQLDQAALNVARKTRWRPAIAHGKPVARCTIFRVQFSLTQGPLVLGGLGERF